ncbi:MAG: hypothetical protein ACFFDT_37815 [Candidatus Hodarchaeota archaeon]
MTISKTSPEIDPGLRQESPERSDGADDGSAVPVLVMCNRCKEKLQIKINPEEIKSRLKSGLFTIEVPHGTSTDSHSTIFYLSLVNDRIQVRDQITADHIADSVTEKSESPQIEPNPRFSEIPKSGKEQNMPKNITTVVLGIGIFLGGLGFSLWMNFDIPSSLIIATYLSFVARYSINFFERKKSMIPSKETPQYLEKLEGSIFQESEHNGVIISNNRTSRFLTIYQLLRSDSSEIPQPLINLALSQHIPLLYMNEGNTHGFLTVENVLKIGAKKKHGTWIHPDISETILETIQYRSSLVEAALKSGGIDFKRLNQLTGVLKVLQKHHQLKLNSEG